MVDTPLPPQLREAEQFLFLLACPLDEPPEGDIAAATKHTFQVFPEAQGSTARPDSRYGTLAEHSQWLQRENERGAGVFVCVHEMDESGRRRSANFKRIRSVVADLDDGIPDQPWPCLPTMIVHTSPGKQHVYWVVGDDMTSEQYVGIQDRLIADWKSDKQVKDVTRVLRLPGFYHRKNVVPHMVTFEVPGNDPKVYRAATLSRVFPPVTKNRGRAISSAATCEVLQPSLTIAANGKKKKTLDEVAEALTHLDADDRETWVKYGHAIKRDHGEVGRDVWLDWSAKSTLYDADEAASKWASFDVSDMSADRVTCGTIVHEAKQLTARDLTAAALSTSSTVKGLAGDEVREFAGKSQDPSSIKNIAIFLQEAGIEPWHNDFNNEDYLRNAAGIDTRVTDTTARDLRMRMHSAGLRVSAEFCNETLLWIASKTTAHPVRRYLEGYNWSGADKDKKGEWDGVPRLDRWLHKYCGAEDTEYHRLVGSKWMIAAVRRVREPGCKFDNMLVLEGAQNAGKSSVFRILAGDAWFTDGMSAGSPSKETIEATCGKWIVECAELAGLTKRDVNEVKQALSKQSDRARLSYGRFPVEVPRQFVICGTTNSTKYLMDVTGGRRFWCVATGAIDLVGLRRDRDQLWAEAAHRETKRERIYLKDAEFDLATVEQAKREIDDPLEIHVEELIGGFNGGIIWKKDMFAALGFENVAKGSATIGAKLSPIMAKYGFRSGRIQDKSESEGKQRQRHCFIADPTVTAGCEAPPPVRVLTLVPQDRDRGKPAYFK